MTREEAIDVVKKNWPDSRYTLLREALETLIPELRDSEDEKIRKALIWHLKADVDFVSNGVTKAECLAYLEKQKEQKPNIELIQRSWYMEGYHDREFGKEPKWILKTGEGGPKHELNPKYGQPLTGQQVTEEQLHNLNEAIKSLRMDGCEKIADSLHSLYDILKTQRAEPAEVDESTKRLNDNWMKQHFDDYEEQKSAQSREEILHQLFQNGSISLSDYLYITGEQKPAEWSEEDSKRYVSIRTTLETSAVLSKEDYDANVAWLRELVNVIKYSGPKPSWKPSEEQMKALWEVEGRMRTNKVFTLSNRLASLYNDLQKLM